MVLDLLEADCKVWKERSVESEAMTWREHLPSMLKTLTPTLTTAYPSGASESLQALVLPDLVGLGDLLDSHSRHLILA